MAEAGNAKDHAQALAIFCAVALGLMGYGAGGAPGALTGAIAGYGIGRLAALFFDSLRIVIANGIVMVAAGLLIVARFTSFEKKIVPPPQAPHVKKELTIAEFMKDYKQEPDDGSGPPRRISVINLCGEPLALYVSWQDERGEWQVNGPWGVPEAAFPELGDLNGVKARTQQSVIRYYAYQTKTGRRVEGDHIVPFKGEQLHMRTVVAEPRSHTAFNFVIDCGKP